MRRQKNHWRRNILPRTNDGAGLFPDHLAKTREVAERAHRLADTSPTRPGLVSTTVVGKISIIRSAKTLRVRTNDSSHIIYYHEENGEAAYVDKSKLDEVIKILRQNMVIDDLADLG